MAVSLPIHGRGANSNPPNRFDPIDIAWDQDSGVDPAERPLPSTVYLRDSSRSIISSNDSPDVGIEASVNPYRGCEHGCVYCLSGDTQILMADGSLRPLERLRIGDEIIGTRRRGWYRRYTTTKVLAHWTTRQLAYRINLENGVEIICGPNHRFLTERGWKFVTPTAIGQRPYLTTNNKLMGFGYQTAAAPGEDVDYRRGYLCGLVRGDGHIGSYRYAPRPGRSKDDQHHFRLALIDREALDRAREYLASFGVATRSFEFQAPRNGRRAMQAIRTNAAASVEKIRLLVRWPDETTTPWRCGFLAGIYDAEGCHSSGSLRISNTDPAILAHLSTALQALGFDFVRESASPARNKPVFAIRVRGGLPEHMRFFDLVNPAIRRKCAIAGIAVKSDAALRIISVKPLGRWMRMFDITTGTGDFIANGVVSHNCYARPTHEYFGLSAGLDFETKIFVKERAPDLLRAELSRKSWDVRTISFSGVTDCYQPVERKLELTRRCLQVMLDFRNPCGVITKNHLVTRDIDLLRELASMDLAVVMLSITTLDKELQRVLEPRASTPARRLDAVEQMARAGIPVGVMTAPVIPGLTDHELPALLKSAADAGARFAGYTALRLPFALAGMFEQWLEHHFPARKQKVLHRIREMRGGKLNDPRFGSRMRGEGLFADQLRSMFQMAKKRAGITGSFPQLSRSHFRRPIAANEQFDLWPAPGSG